MTHATSKVLLALTIGAWIGGCSDGDPGLQDAGDNGAADGGSEADAQRLPAALSAATRTVTVVGPASLKPLGPVFVKPRLSSGSLELVIDITDLDTATPVLTVGSATTEDPAIKAEVSWVPAFAGPPRFDYRTELTCARTGNALTCDSPDDASFWLHFRDPLADDDDLGKLLGGFVLELKRVVVDLTVAADNTVSGRLTAELTQQSTSLIPVDLNLDMKIDLDGGIDKPLSVVLGDPTIDASGDGIADSYAFDIAMELEPTTIVALD